MSRLLACLLCSVALLAQATYDPSVLPKGREYFVLRDGLGTAHHAFARRKQARVAFLGGSITAGQGWRELVMADLQRRFPDTTFDFVSAGIPSMGSVPHAFRLERDVLSKGPIDLLFVEAAVNDTTNTSDPAYMRRGMEGVVRRARAANPLTDIVHLHFVMPEHMADYRAGRVPASIAQHEAIAAAYGNPSLHLSQEVTDRIDAGQFTWEADFKDLHPSPFGHQLYARSIARMLDAAWAGPVPTASSPHAMPTLVDARSYARGRFGTIADVRIVKGFMQVASWRPVDGTGTRTGFVDVPALVGTAPGATFGFTFEGTAAGLLVTAGPDAGQVEFSIDGSAFRSAETFTRWSPGLHLPWAVMLDDGLPPGRHEVTVRIAEGHDPRSIGTALRVFQLLLN